MKNKGFTLIELLAVITILSIILLIAFISIGGVISNSKESLSKSQIKQIEKAAEYYNNKEGLRSYSSCINVSYLTENGYIKENEVKDPKTGETLTGSVKILYDNKKYSYQYDEEGCLCSSKDEDISIDRGKKYTCKVNDNDEFDFYILGTEGTGENQKVNLIMDRNICGTDDENNGKPTASGRICSLAWYSYSNDDKNGPVTAMEGIYNATKNWDNVPDMKMDYEDEGNNYRKIETLTSGTIIKNSVGAGVKYIGTSEEPLKARLPKYNEVYNNNGDDATYCHLADGSCPVWLVNNLETYLSYYPENTHISGIQAYWTLSSFPDSGICAIYVSYKGLIASKETSYNDNIGIRPVITISTSDMTHN